MKKGEPWRPIDAPDFDPPLLHPHEVQKNETGEALPSAELYEVYQGPVVKPLKMIRIRQCRKKEPHIAFVEADSPELKLESEAQAVWSQARLSALAAKESEATKTKPRFEVGMEDEKKEASERLSSTMKQVPSAFTEDGMGRQPTGKSVRSRQRSSMLSETLAEIVKERKEEEMREALKAKIYEQGQLAKNVGNKAAEVVKSMDVDLSRLDKQRQAMHGWISSSFFDSFIGFIILINAVIIGFEAEVSTQIPFGCDESCQCGDAGRQSECFAMPEWLQAVDYVFAGIYIAEFGLRLYTYGIAVLRSNWVKFDLFLILSSMLDIALKQVATVSEVLTQILLVRILRLARLARAVRLMVQFRVLWQLVQGLLHSVSTLLWTFLMVMILVYGFAIVGIETIHVDLTLPLEHPYNVAVMQNFDRFSDAMLTLFQCFTLDSAGEVYRPLITHNPVLIAYFMTVILVMAVSLMNLVTAIMVNSALDQASEDKDVKRAYEAVQKRKQLEQLKVMFLELDTDGSGELTLEELKTAPEEVREQLEAVAGTEDIEGLFQMLDYDGGGSLDTSEFCEGVLKASTSEKPLELTRLVKQCSDILRLCRNMYVNQKQKTAGDMEKELKQLQKNVDIMQQRMNEQIEKLQSDVGRIMNSLEVPGR
ncbi:unnamed protein product [Durusdinium trenchii]|uniref:Voltage-dependent calcium channel type A subunit alpha-1 (Cacophony protein) n=2 Tax=Durusdinium trenchii TaxID=1381693 RepID=A0ABP0QNB1_9DINO